MAAKERNPARKNKRKARTEVSSDSDSDSGISRTSSPAVEGPPPTERTVSTNQQQSVTSTAATQQSFEDFYLRQCTQEFANDLDKLRQAGDFNEKSIPILIDSLKQGTACFDPAERARIGGRGNVAS